MIRLIQPLLLLLILAIVDPSFATEKRVEYESVKFLNIGLKDGLSHSTVNAIVQDNSGLMWFGTRNGLCRYDGYSVSTFRHDKSDSLSINHNFINRLHNDSIRNRIWISNQSGVSYYDQVKDCFVRCDVGTNINNVSFLETIDGEFLIGSSKGVFRFNAESDSFDPYILHGSNRESILSMTQDESGLLWILSNRGLCAYNTSLKRKDALPEVLRPYKSRTQALYALSKRYFMIVSNLDILIYDTDRGLLNKIASRRGILSIRCAELDSMGNIWIGTEDGILVYDMNSNRLANYKQSQFDVSNLNDSPIYNIYRDDRNNMWVGTYFGGVNYFINDTDVFRQSSFGYTKNQLSGKVVRKIINAPNDALYIATEDGGLNYMDRNKRITRNRDLLQDIPISHKNVHTLLIDTEGKLWIGMFQKGLACYDPKTKQVQFINNEVDGVSSVFCIAEDSLGRIWYGGPRGLSVVSKVGGDYVAKKISSMFVFCMMVKDDSTIWLGTRFNGLYKLDCDTESITPIGDSFWKRRFITYIYTDAVGDIWVGTNDDGLFQLDSDGELKRSVTYPEIETSAIRSIIDDEAGDVWVSTEAGLYKIDCKTSDISCFTEVNGLPVNQFNYNSANRRSNGELMFGTIGGLISFNPKNIHQKRPEFRVVLTNVWSNNELLSPNNPKGSIPSSIQMLDELTLSYEQAQSLRIEYSGVNYQYGDKTQYAMKIDGVDSDWQLIGTQQQVRVSNLTNGRYVLNIKASGDGVDWDEAGALSLLITVLPPWWASWWAYIIYCLLIMAVIFIMLFYIKMRISLIMQLKTESHQRINMEKLNQQKINFFTYVSHDLKTPLTLIISPLQRMLNNQESNTKDNLQIILRNANRMNYLIDELLTFSKIEMKRSSIVVRHGNIISLLDELSHIFSMLARDKEIDFIVDLPNTEEKVWFSPSKLERIMYNLLSNAFKYTQPDDFVKLSAELQHREGQTFVRISVKDSGRGIPKDMLDKIFDSYVQVDKRDHREGFGLGLSLTRSLINMHKGEVEVVSEVGVGSEFIVTLNVSESAYDESQRSNEEITTDGLRKYNDRLNDRMELITEEIINAEEPQPSKPTLLIVEDNKEMNGYIADIFKSDYTLLRAYNGAAGLEMVKRCAPSLVISDVMMPEMDGLEMTTRIKQDLESSHIPVILLTAKSEEKDHTEGYESGADGYMPKPFNSQNLTLLVRNILSTRAQNVERFKRAKDLNIDDITYGKRDENFVKELIDLIKQNITSEEFGVMDITTHFKISRSLLHNKLKALTGCSTTQFVRSVKMKEAKTHLLGGMNVSECAYAVGIYDPNYFTKCFKKEFGITPSEFINSL